MCDWHTKILQEPTEPDNLLNSRSQSTEFSLDTGTSNSGLLLGLPNNEGRTNEQTIASDRVTIIRTTRPGGIGVSLQLKRGLARVEETMGGSVTEVARDSQEVSIMD